MKVEIKKQILFRLNKKEKKALQLAVIESKWDSVQEYLIALIRGDCLRRKLWDNKQEKQ